MKEAPHFLTEQAFRPTALASSQGIHRPPRCWPVRPCEVLSWTQAGPPRCAVAPNHLLALPVGRPIPPDVLSTNTVRPESLSMSACSCAVEPLCGSGITDPTGPLTSCVSFVSSTAASFAVDDGMGDWPCQGRLEIPPMRGCRTRSAVRARVYVPFRRCEVRPIEPLGPVPLSPNLTPQPASPRRHLPQPQRLPHHAAGAAARWPQGWPASMPP